MVEAALKELEADAETERARKVAMAARAANVAQPSSGKNKKSESKTLL